MPLNVTAIAEAAKEIFGIANTLTEEAVDQKHESAHKYRMDQWNEAESIKDSLNRADARWNAVLRLLSEGGKTYGGNGRNIQIPIDTLANMFELASEGIRDKALLNRKK